MNSGISGTAADIQSLFLYRRIDYRNVMLSALGCITERVLHFEQIGPVSQDYMNMMKAHEVIDLF